MYTEGALMRKSCNVALKYLPKKNPVLLGLAITELFTFSGLHLLMVVVRGVLGSKSGQA